MRKTLLIIGLCLILTLRFFTFFSHIEPLVDGQEVSFTTRLRSEPRSIGSRQYVTANYNPTTRLQVLFGQFPQVHYGDVVHISGTVHAQKTKETSTQKIPLIGFDNTYATVYSAQVSLVKNEQKSIGDFVTMPLAVASVIRQQITAQFTETLPQSYAGLLLGIVFGIKGAMPSSLIADFKTVGVMHVIAASGMNVTLVAGFLAAVTMPFFRRQIALLISLGGIFCYVLLSGFDPSIVRAAIMAMWVFVGQLSGRQTLPILGLLFALFVMLMGSPILLFDIGFQLSFAATAGLLFASSFTLGIRLQKKWWAGDLVTTIAAQIATIPILIANFGTYPLLSILVNFLVLWTIPPLMIVGGVGAIVGLAMPIVGKAILLLSYPMLWYFESLVHFFSTFHAVFTVENLPWQFAFGYYFFLIAAYLIVKGKGVSVKGKGEK